MNSFLQKEPVNASALTWLADAEALEKQKAVGWVKALRATGAEQFGQTGLPTPAWEGWQHTSLRALNNSRFHYATEAVKFDVNKIPPKLLAASDRLVLVNGQYQPQLSTVPKGVTVMSLMDAVAKQPHGIDGIEPYLVTVGDLKRTPFKALNTAYMRDGLVLKVKDNTEISQPLEILFYNMGNAEKSPAIYPRTLYWLGENSSLTLVERHAGEGVYLSNGYTGITLEPASRLKCYKFEEESESAFHFSFTVLQQQKDSSFEGFICATGGKLAREEYQNLLIDSANLE